MTEEALERLRAKAMRALAPIRPANAQSPGEDNIFFQAARTNAGRSLPPYYAVFFLLVELLKFRNLGQWEKMAWSVPIEYEGKVFLIDHRKFGVGIFCVNPELHEDQARQICNRITKACKIAKPYFSHLASEAIKRGELSIHNNHRDLLARLRYLIGRYRAAVAFETKAHSKQLVSRTTKSGGFAVSFRHRTAATKKVAWAAQAVIEAFFSWTEHILVHVAVLDGKVTNGDQLLRLTMADWPDKYRRALPISGAPWKRHYDSLLQIRREHRNFTAHGAFGKDGRAFAFHSDAGAVPLSLPDEIDAFPHFNTSPVLSDRDAVGVLEEWIMSFQQYKAPHWLLLESQLDTVLPFSGTTYRAATQSVEAMEAFVDHQQYFADMSANMDW